MPSRAAAYAASYGASWSPSASRHGSAGSPADPTYPAAITGTQEFKVEGDGLTLDDGEQHVTWPEDWALPDFTKTTGAQVLEKHNIFDDESAVLFTGTQSGGPQMDRGSALTAQGGLTVFIVVHTDGLDALSTHSTMLQASRGATLSRMSFVARREEVGNFLAWWDVSAGWLETSVKLADNTDYVISYRSDNTSLKVAVNGGAEEAIGNPTHQQQEEYTIGTTWAGAEPFPGKIGAVIWYRSHISDADRILIRDYLNSKYSVY